MNQQFQGIAEMGFGKVSDIFSMKKQGYLIWKSYFSTFDKVMDSIIAVLKQRMGIEPEEYKVS